MKINPTPIPFGRFRTAPLQGVLAFAALAALACSPRPPGETSLRQSLRADDPYPAVPVDAALEAVEEQTADHQRRWGWSAPEGLLSFRWSLSSAPGRLLLPCATAPGVTVVLEDPASGFEARHGPLAEGWHDLEFDLPAARKGRDLLLRFEGCPTAPETTSPCAWGDARFRTGPETRVEPNLLFVLVDTMRFDALGAYGSRNRTPVFDSLARDGVLFERMYAQSSWTLPSVSSLVSGLWPSESPGWTGPIRSVAPSATPLAEILRGAGFTTAAFVANPVLEDRYYGRGFDTWWGSPPEDSVFTPAPELSSRAISWLGTHQRDRFFLYLHLMDPHDPYAVPDRREGNDPSRWPGHPDPAFLGQAPMPSATEVAHWRELYDEEVAFADREIGRVLAALDPEVRARTIVVVTSDHGEEFLEHGFLKHGLTLFEEVVRVPFVIAWPGALNAGVRIPEVARLVDAVPTLVDLLSVRVEETLRRSWAGASLAAAVRGEVPMPSLVAMGETFAQGPLRWYATDGQRKVVLFNRGFRMPGEMPVLEHPGRWVAESTPAMAAYRFTDGEPWDKALEPPPAADLAWGRALAAHYAAGRSGGLWAVVRGEGSGARLRLLLESRPTSALHVSPLFWPDGDLLEPRPDGLLLDLLDDGIPRALLVSEEPGDRLQAVQVSSLDGSLRLIRERPPFDPAPGIYWWKEHASAGSTTAEAEAKETLSRLRALGYIR